MTDVPLQLFDPRVGDPALIVESIAIEPGSTVAQRTNRFTMIWSRQGCGTFRADEADFAFGGGSLLFSVPYQAVSVQADDPVQGDRVEFHANFFCIETYHEEVGCNGVLFNDIYGAPVVRLDRHHEREFAELIAAMRREIQEAGLAHSEVLVSYLKILLVRATRLKLDQQEVGWDPQPKRPAVIDELQQLVEQHYRVHHRPGEYAMMLHLSPKSLAKLVKTHLRKTLTELIRDRIMRQAKWELLHTRKAVKQIARELGFRDVFYFSRLFRQATGCSPTFFRDYETEIRGGRNLSMS